MSMEKKNGEINFQNRSEKVGTQCYTLPGGGPGDGPTGVHEHTPAVASGGVALDRLVQSS